MEATMSGPRAERSEGGLVSVFRISSEIWCYLVLTPTTLWLYDIQEVNLLLSSQITCSESWDLIWFDMIWYDETLRAACDRTHWERRNAIGTPFCLLRRAGTYGDAGAAVASLQDTSRILAVGCFIPDCQLLVVEYHGFLRIDLPNGSLVVGEDPREAHVRSGIFAVSQRCGATGLAVCWLLMLGSDRKGESFLTRHVSFSKPALCRNDMVIPQIGQS